MLVIMRIISNATKKEQTLSCHNVAYKVRATYCYCLASNPPQTVGPLTIERTFVFANLTVNSEPKILKWDPDVPENCDTTFSYTLSSAQKKNCQVQILIYDMEGNVVYQANLTQLCPGTYTFTWDGTTSSGSIAPTGLYTFDIIANGKTPDGQIINEDKDEMRSSLLKIQQTYMDIDPDNPGKFKFGYVLESVDGKLPSELEVKVYGSALENFVEKTTLQGGKKVIPPGTTPTEEDWNFVSFSQDLCQVGGALEVPRADRLYAVVVGKDDNMNNKAHNRKPILERNQEDFTPTAALFWASDVGEAELLGGAMDFAGLLLTGGVFKMKNNKPEDKALHFSGSWSYKKGNTYVTRPMVMSANLQDPEARQDYGADGAIKALKNVQVFAFAGHGNGWGIEFGPGYGSLALSYEQGYPSPFYRVDDVFSNNALSNLFLVVVGSCNREMLVPGTPLVQTLVKQKGARFGIGVRAKETITQGGFVRRILTPRSFQYWSNLFWSMVAGYYTDEDTKKKVYPKVLEAAKKAVDKANRRINHWNKDPKHLPQPNVEVNLYSRVDNDDAYLGDIHP